MIKDFAFDIPDERDYKYWSVFENEIKLWSELPSKVLLDNVEYQNQWLEEITKNMCVFYSTWHWSNEENFLEWSDVRINNKDLWLKALELGRLDVEKGAMVSDWPKTARDMWLIKWWALIETVDEAKHSIFKNRPIVVWSNKIKWSLWYKAPFVLWGNSWSWHAVLIIWFDDNYEGWCFIIKNSYWPEKYDHGKFYLKYTDFNLLFGWKFSLIDQEDQILSYKEKIMENIDLEWAKKQFKKGNWNWLNPRDPMSRQEVMAVMYRQDEKNLIIIKELLKKIENLQK